MIDSILPNIAGRWEHASLLIEGLIAYAVHSTDCLDYDRVCGQMKLAAGYYEGLADLFTDACPGVFPKAIARIPEDGRSERGCRRRFTRLATIPAALLTRAHSATLR